MMVFGDRQPVEVAGRDVAAQSARVAFTNAELRDVKNAIAARRAKIRQELEGMGAMPPQEIVDAVTESLSTIILPALAPALIQDFGPASNIDVAKERMELIWDVIEQLDGQFDALLKAEETYAGWVRAWAQRASMGGAVGSHGWGLMGMRPRGRLCKGISFRAVHAHQLGLAELDVGRDASNFRRVARGGRNVLRLETEVKLW